MTIEYVPPIGIACNLKCAYCYQDKMRDAGNITTTGDWEKAKLAIEREGGPFTVFGGEPLLASIKHLEEVFAYGLEKFKRNTIQTNGLLITPAHIEMFKKYKVACGVSIDGPDDCNSPRSTREQTRQIIKNIIALRHAQLTVGLIITVHKYNAFRHEEMIGWLEGLRKYGITSFNFHILESDDEKVQKELGVNNTENLNFFIHLYKYFKPLGGHVNPFMDITKLLTEINPKDTSCIWNACDPLTTRAVTGIRGDGELMNCGRTNKDGVDWIKTSGPSTRERYMALFNTPQEHGGCQGCRYFYACKGQCPGTAIDNDWRNKTTHCSFWYDLMQFIEADLRRNGKETLSLAEMTELAINVVTPPKRATTTPHGDSPHGDIPHGDHHGDHTDVNLVPKGVPVTWID